MNVNLSKAPGPVREFEGARGVAGRYEKGRCNGPEAGVRLECSRTERLQACWNQREKVEGYRARNQRENREGRPGKVL